MTGMLPGRRRIRAALPSSFPPHGLRASDGLCLTRPGCGTGQFVWTVLGSLPGSRRSSCCQQPAVQPRGDPTSAPTGPTPGAVVLTPPCCLGEEFRMGFPPSSHPSPSPAIPDPPSPQSRGDNPAPVGFGIALQDFGSHRIAACRREGSESHSVSEPGDVAVPSPCPRRASPAGRRVQGPSPAGKAPPSFIGVLSPCCEAEAHEH